MMCLLWFFKDEKMTTLHIGKKGRLRSEAPFPSSLSSFAIFCAQYSPDVPYPLSSLVRSRIRNRKEIQPSSQVYPNLHRRNLNSDNPFNNTISHLRIQLAG